MWEADNARQYMQKGRHSVNLGRGWQQAARMLDNIISCADDDITSGRRGLRMRFGHDGCLMALLALLEADSWGTATDNLDEVKDLADMAHTNGLETQLCILPQPVGQ